MPHEFDTKRYESAVEQFRARLSQLKDADEADRDEDAAAEAIDEALSMLEELYESADAQIQLCAVDYIDSLAETASSAYPLLDKVLNMLDDARAFIHSRL